MLVWWCTVPTGICVSDAGALSFNFYPNNRHTQSRSWIVQTVGVAIANSTYAAARRIARFAAPTARNAFPTLDMFRPA